VNLWCIPPRSEELYNPLPLALLPLQLSLTHLGGLSVQSAQHHGDMQMQQGSRRGAWRAGLLTKEQTSVPGGQQISRIWAT
jgi:hypothetical protein